MKGVVCLQLAEVAMLRSKGEETWSVDTLGC